MRLFFTKKKFNIIFISCVFVISATLVFTHIKLVQYYKNTLQDKFSLSQERAFTIFEDKINSYVHGLQGTAGVFRALEFQYNPKFMREYAESRNLFSNFEGSLGFGVIRNVKNANTYLKNQKKLTADFKIKNIGNNNGLHFIIETIEPVENNKPAIGLNIASEKHRREAAFFAMIHKETIITREINLVQGTKESIGYLILHPIYKNPIAKNEENPQSNLIAFSYTPILAGEIVKYLKQRVEFDFNLEVFQEGSSSYLFKKGAARSSDYQVKFNKQILGRNWIWVASKKFGSELKAITYSSILIHLIVFLSLIYFIYLFISNIEDINEKVNKNTELESWLNVILDSTDFAIISTDTSGIIKTFNRSAENMLGYSASEIVNLHGPGIFHDHDELLNRAADLTNELKTEVQIGFEVFTKKAQIGFSDINEWTYIRKNGSRLKVRLAVTAIKSVNGEIIGYLVVAEDLTEVNKLQQTIEMQNLKITESARLSAIGEMASSVAHEINNPLTAINSLVMLINKKIARNDITLQQVSTELVKVNNLALRISKIISGLRSLSRDPSQDPMIKFSVKTAIDDALAICSQKFINFDINLILDIDKDIEVMMRPTQVSQVVLNLLSNAFDEIHSLEQRWIKIKLDIGENVKIRFTDSGRGISDELIAKIMQPFYTTKEYGKGTGLGLSISKSIIEAHSGKLYYELDGENTSFVIELPI